MSKLASSPSRHTREEEKSFYDDMWNRYGHLEAESPAAFHRRRLVVELAAQAVGPTARVLDVGCGQGELLHDLAARLPSLRIAGADLSEQSLRTSRANNPTFDLFELDLADPELTARHPERLGAFDLVLCCEVLEHIPDDQSAARNLTALLAPGGVLIVTVPGGKMSRFDQAIGHQHHYSAEHLRALLGGAGLRVESVVAWGFPFHTLYRAAVRAASRFWMPQGMSTPLSTGYVAFSRILSPLFYLNLKRGGEQMIAVSHATH
jgi:2-polyprenyl-3-methyl-5-hydroxy-6-metoxy-1,4-benzoquinol methylase